MSSWSKSNSFKGIFWTILACFFSGIMVNMVKHVSVDLNTIQIIFLRNIFAFLMFTPLIAVKGVEKIKTKRIKTHILRSVTGLISMTIFFYTISKMNIATVTAVSFTAPLFTAIFAIYFFKDKLNFHQFFALFVGFMGVLIVVRPGGDAFNPMALLVLVSAIFWALSGITIKKLAETEQPMVTTFYMTVFMAIFSAPFAFTHWNECSLENYLWIFGIAIASNFLQYGSAKALTHSDFSVILPFDFTRLVFSAGIAYLVFEETMDFNTLVGAMVICVAAFYAVLNERRKIRKLTGVEQLNKGL